MSAEDQDLFGKMIRVENKDLFVDLRKNSNGIYLKLSERRGTMRKTVLIPASGIAKLQAVLEEAANIVNEQRGQGKAAKPVAAASAPAPASPAVVNSNSVYVAGLSWATTEEMLAKHFQSVGPIVKATILRKPRRGKIVSIGCGIVEFSSAAEAQRAINTLNNTTLDDRTITCREDRKIVNDTEGAEETGGKAPRTKNVSATKVFVTSAGFDTSPESLSSHFNIIGDVKSILKLSGGKGKKRGNWVVEYEDPESVGEAIVRLHDSELDGHKVSVREYVEND